MFRDLTADEMEKYSITDENAKIDKVWSEGIMLVVILNENGIDTFVYTEDLSVPDHYRIAKNDHNKQYLHLIARGTAYDVSISLLENGYEIVSFGASYGR